jgi:2,4-dienoyl-CoA reductase-like NADH-dependent reductase (Old Yellow Enzyme family)
MHGADGHRACAAATCVRLPPCRIWSCTLSNDTLFRPLVFGSHTLRNRIVMAPMTRRRAPQGIPGPDVAAYYRRRAEGGVGLIISEGTYIDHPGASCYENAPDFFGDAALAGWRKVLHEVHDAGACMIPQLWHVGSYRRLGMAPDAAVPGFGPVAISEDGVERVRAITDRDVEEIAASYARGAAAAQGLGFDGVAVHGAHGYLADQFFWTKTNTRADALGGDLAARCRFAAAIVAAMRAAVGPDFPIVFRFSQWKQDDYDAAIADTPEELGVILDTLRGAGVDVFDVSTRRFWTPAFPGSDLSLAAWTKRLSGKSVIAVGCVGLDQPHQSKFYRTKDNVAANVTDVRHVVEAMARGDFDLVAAGRALLADPQWPNKVRQGDFASIKPFRHEDMARYD